MKKFWAKFMRSWKRRRNRTKDQPKRDDFDPPTVTITDRTDAPEEQDQSNAPSDPAFLSFLYALTKRWAWGAVAFRCETHPEEAQSMEQDSNGDTILHWACFGSPPVYVIEAILQVCPELAMIRNHKGFLPLHTACCYRANAGVVRALVQAYPESAGMVIESSAEQGRSRPLHLLCDYGCHADSLRAILATKEGVMSCRKKDWIYCRTPLQILNERKNLNEFHLQMTELRRLRAREPDALVLLQNGDRHDNSMETALLLERIRTMGFWEKAQLLALAEFTQQPVTTLELTNTTVIHALIGLKICPSSILEYAGFLLPQDLVKRDEHGDLPLHFAARRSNDDVICDVLRAQTKAASMPDASGVLPLQIYLERDKQRGWNHVMMKLFVAFPLAIEHLDIDRRLYPLLWSRLSVGASRTPENLDALFLSIQGNPSCFGCI